nr:MAG TPA: hypothetical protein [Caudoviricetes sp.]
MLLYLYVEYYNTFKHKTHPLKRANLKKIFFLRVEEFR